MRHVETNQITFGKLTKKLIVSLLPNAKTFKKIGNDFVIRDCNGVMVATWHKRSCKNGLIVINN